MIFYYVKGIHTEAIGNLNGGNRSDALDSLAGQILNNAVYFLRQGFLVCHEGELLTELLVVGPLAFENYCLALVDHRNYANSRHEAVILVHNLENGVVVALVLINDVLYDTADFFH